VHQQEGKVTTNGNRATDIAAVGSKRRRRNGFLKKKGEEMVFEKKGELSQSPCKLTVGLKIVKCNQCHQQVVKETKSAYLAD
jgi:hypothetical protein